MQPHGQAAPKEMLGRMAFAFCTYVMAFSTPGCIPVVSLSQLISRCYQNVAHLFLLSVCFIYRFGCPFLALGICILCHLSRSKSRDFMCILSPFKYVFTPWCNALTKDTLLRIHLLNPPKRYSAQTHAFCLSSIKG